METTRSATHSAPVVPAEQLRTVVNARSKELGLTRDRLAKAAGIGRSTLFDWLSGTTQPSPTGWLALAGALGMSVPELFASVGCPLESEVEKSRLSHGWTRADLAAKAGVAGTTVRALETGQHVRADAAARVGEALGMGSGFVRQSARVHEHARTALGRAIEAERLRRGWNISDLARHLGMARQMVSAWMLGNEPVSAKRLPALAELTGLTLAEVAALAEVDRASFTRRR